MIKLNVAKQKIQVNDLNEFKEQYVKHIYKNDNNIIDINKKLDAILTNDKFEKINKSFNDLKLSIEKLSFDDKFEKINKLSNDLTSIIEKLSFNDKFENITFLLEEIQKNIQQISPNKSVPLKAFKILGPGTPTQKKI